MGFDWDPENRKSNLKKHGIDFVDAVQVFEGFVLRREDARRNYGERRLVAIGRIGDQLLSVVYTVRGDSIRGISARRANRNEARESRALRPEEA